MRGGVDVISWRSSLRSRFGKGEGQWAQRDFDDERGRREWKWKWKWKRKRKRKRKLASLVGDVRHQTPHPKAPFGRQGSDTPHQIFNTCVGVESMGLNKNSAAPGRRISCQPRCSILSAPRLMADSSSTGWQAPMHRFGADGGDESLLVGLADGEVVASSCSQ